MLISLAFIVTGLPVGQSAMSATKILKRSQAVYDSVKTLDENVTGSIRPGSGTAHILFQRPGKFRITGKTMFGPKYELICDGHRTWVFSAGKWSELQSLQMGVASITGISANAGTMIPTVLSHLQMGIGLDPAAGPFTVAKEKINGHGAYRLHKNSPFPLDMWIDAKSYLLLRTTANFGGRSLTVVFAKPKLNGPIPSKTFAH